MLDTSLALTPPCHVAIQDLPGDRGALYHLGRSGSPPVTIDPDRVSPSARTPAADVETTIDLLRRARSGSLEARERLVERCLPALRRWARGRLPAHARHLHDTADLVQDTVVAALARLDGFEARREGALQAYLRQALLNRITDIIRYQRRRPGNVEVPDDLRAREASPLELAIGQENVRRYEQALARLRPDDREAIVARLELQYSYDELAVALGKPNANAARAAVLRAMARLAIEMRTTGH